MTNYVDELVKNIKTQTTKANTGMLRKLLSYVRRVVDQETFDSIEDQFILGTYPSKVVYDRKIFRTNFQLPLARHWFSYSVLNFNAVPDTPIEPTVLPRFTTGVLIRNKDKLTYQFYDEKTKNFIMAIHCTISKVEQTEEELYSRFDNLQFSGRMSVPSNPKNVPVVVRTIGLSDDDYNTIAEELIIE